MAPVTLRRGEGVLHVNALEALPSLNMQTYSAGAPGIADHIQATFKRPATLAQPRVANVPPTPVFNAQRVLHRAAWRPWPAKTT